MKPEIILLIVSVAVFAAMIVLLVYQNRRQQAMLEKMQADLNRALSELRRELSEGVQSNVSYLWHMILEQHRTSFA